jgi:hypothetical protein
MGQTTSLILIKSNVLIMGSCELNGEVYSWRKGKGMFTFMAGMIQKIFSIRWEAPTVLDLHPNSPDTD